jgi:molecular chaperone HtpG
VYHKLEKLHDSRFFQRLETCEKAPEYSKYSSDISNLKASAINIANHAQAISDHTVHFLPQYTLHNGTHLWNVLSLMEMLVPQETIDNFGPVQCALTIITAFIHDLGMVPSEEEHQKIINGQDQDYNLFEQGQTARLDDIERLRKKGKADYAIGLLKGCILTDYLRTTHTGEARITGWLDRLQQSDDNLTLKYGGVWLKRPLVLIAMSHGQDIGWLSRSLRKNGLTANGLSYGRKFGPEEVNYVFISWLLRLADIMDFDASRTPEIVFHHLGITDPISKDAWQKHLAISNVEFKEPGENCRLIYQADACPSPIVHKHILWFCELINKELHDTAYAIGALSGDACTKYGLELPLEAVPEITPEQDEDGIPLYEYHDMEFRLNQQNIMDLLMGEELYGEPDLCIRELLQNALDALELREIRSKLPKGQRLEPVDQPKPKELRVNLTWGEDDQGQFIRVEDNGVGMTRAHH